MSTPWTDDQLDRIGGSAEVEIAPRRPDGSLRPFTTIWVVGVDRDLYVRSYRGPGGGWFQAARRSGAGRVRVGDDEFDIAFERPLADRDTVDRAYRHKYGRSGYVDAMVADGVAAATLRLVPRR